MPRFGVLNVFLSGLLSIRSFSRGSGEGRGENTCVLVISERRGVRGAVAVNYAHLDNEYS